MGRESGDHVARLHRTRITLVLIWILRRSSQLGAKQQALPTSAIIMFQFDGGKKERETCFVTHGAMGHLDPAQPPVKRKPYSAILAVPFVHKV